MKVFGVLLFPVVQMLRPFFTMAIAMQSLAGAAEMPSTMQAFIAPSSNASSFYFNSSFPVPNINRLKEDFTNLPDGAHPVMLQVLCSSVNPSDLTTDAYLKPNPLGSDVVGIVIEVGSDQSPFKVGDIVWGDIGANVQLATDPSVTTKELGALAEIAVALDTQLALAPLREDDNASLLELCGLPKVGLTTWKALSWYAGAPWVQPTFEAPETNVSVLVLGGSGGTGSAGIQMAKAFGSTMVAATASPDNFEYCEELGADLMIDYHTTEWSEVFSPGEIDVIYDTVGEPGTAEKAFSILSRHGGHFVTIADFSDVVVDVPAGVTFSKFINSDTNLVSAPEMQGLSAMYEAGQLRMPSVAVYGLSQTAEAFATSAEGHVVGKLVISISNETSLSASKKTR